MPIFTIVVVFPAKKGKAPHIPHPKNPSKNNFDNSKEFCDLYQYAKSKEIKLPNISPADFEMAYNKVELEIEKCKKHKIDMISYNDSEYLIEFKSIDNPNQE